jgi:hypothetical protein
VGTRYFFLSPQLQFRNLKKEALPQLFKTEMLLRNRKTPQSHYFLMSKTSSPQFSHIFGRGAGQGL